MKSVIAIVGRPNVGKSTLFNRLTHTRSALVADEPGVTRDRQYGFGHHNEHKFIVVDTGGLGSNDNNTDNIANLIAEQTLRAVKEANSIIWLVDGQEGLTPCDETLAKELRPHCDHIYLAVNKTEGQDENIITAEFHALGTGQPYAISALHGSGVTSLMDNLTNDLPIHEDVYIENDQSLRITVLGRPNVGKSTLVNRILGDNRVLTCDEPGTTRDSIDIPFERDGKSYTLIDTAGVRRRARVNKKIEKFSIIKTLQAVDETQIVILVIDAQEAITDQDANLLGLVLDSGKALLITVNKWDGLDPSHKSRIRDQLDRKLGFIDYACIHFISALHGSGVGNIFDSIQKIGKSISITPSTSDLTTFLQHAVEAHSPPLIRGRRIKLRYAHLGGHNPLRVIIHGNQTEHVTEPYRRYLANVMRKNLRLVGTPVLIEFKQSDNPYKGRKNVLTKRQTEKRKRMIRHTKKH